jgi:hypothetical protein
VKGPKLVHGHRFEIRTFHFLLNSPDGDQRAGPSGVGAPVNVDALAKSYHRTRREQNFRQDRIM